ncbi:MAG: hypothetical protein GY849_17525, partial [Deltaproteobacteria bacterium]|nr:hypothetical protein [Deltaproteobacteria bacterium]
MGIEVNLGMSVARLVVTVSVAVTVVSVSVSVIISVINVVASKGNVSSLVTVDMLDNIVGGVSQPSALVVNVRSRVVVVSISVIDVAVTCVVSSQVVGGGHVLHEDVMRSVIVIFLVFTVLGLLFFVFGLLFVVVVVDASSVMGGDHVVGGVMRGNVMRGMVGVIRVVVLVFRVGLFFRVSLSVVPIVTIGAVMDGDAVVGVIRVVVLVFRVSLFFRVSLLSVVVIVTIAVVIDG